MNTTTREQHEWTHEWMSTTMNVNELNEMNKWKNNKWNGVEWTMTMAVLTI